MNINELKTKINELEDDNQHGEVCQIIARFSGCKYAKAYADAAQALHLNLGHLSEPAQLLRIEAYRCAWHGIVRKHGEDVAAEIMGSEPKRPVY